MIKTLAYIIFTSIFFLGLILVKEIKHTSEILMLQKEYIELLDVNHMQHEQVDQAIQMLNQRDKLIQDLNKLIKLMDLELKKRYSTKSWAENENKTKNKISRSERL
jgi:hypothetical protein